VKPTIIRTSNPAPWFHRYQYATRGFAIRIARRRMLALAAKNARTWRRIARTYEEANHD
jgi:hypothetical protein